MNADTNPDRLRQALRQGDPAAQEPGLTADEVHTMRRTVLTAIPEPRRPMAWFPLVATGAAALLALALAVAFWHRSPVPDSPVQAPVRMAAVPVPIPAAVPTVRPVAATSQGPVKVSRPALRHPARTVRAPKALPVSPIRQDDTPVLTASLPVREIQFSTPGGTRVIWELSGKDVR
jgi:hypothetical protein